MSRDPRYQRLLNSPRWGVVKAIVWQRAKGQCERCKEEGIVTGSGTTQLDCHHIVPVESAKTEQEMERLCYDVNNIRLLCVACHTKTHAEAKSHTREKVAENKRRARQRFLEANDPSWRPDGDDG